MTKRKNDIGSPRATRSDAQRNYGRLLEAAQTVVTEQGTEASLRDIARRAGVGLGTFYRNFPTRDSLLETLLRKGFDDLADKACMLEASHAPYDALTTWLRAFTAGAASYRGLSSSMMATFHNKQSLLHASCLRMREAAQRLLKRAQNSGDIRTDIDGMDLFLLINALAWIAEQAPSVADRKEHLFSLVMDGLKQHPKPGKSTGRRSQVRRH